MEDYGITQIFMKLKHTQTALSKALSFKYFNSCLHIFELCKLLQVEELITFLGLTLLPFLLEWSQL